VTCLSLTSKARTYTRNDLPKRTGRWESQRQCDYAAAGSFACRIVKMKWPWLFALACAYDLLQLSDPQLVLSLPSALPVHLPSSTCVQSLTHYTVAGWFRTERASVLLTLETPRMRVQIEKKDSGAVRVVVGADALELSGTGGGWEYVALSFSSTNGIVSLCSAAWKQSVHCSNLALTVGSLELAQAFIHYGSAAGFPTHVLDVLIAPLALSPEEVEYLSRNGVCGEGCEDCSEPGACSSAAEHRGLFLTAMCEKAALASGPPYGDHELYPWFDWTFGLNMFYYDVYDFSPNYSTKKVVFELSEVYGDPDMEVMVFHVFRENEWLGESHNPGADTLTFDWNTPRFRDGIDWTTTLRVYISGKTWFTFYTLLTTFYSAKLYRSGSQPLVLPQRVARTAVAVQRPVLWALGLVVLGGVGWYWARKRARQEDLVALRTPLLDTKS